MKTFVRWLLLLFIVMLLAGGVLGSWRYGSPSGLLRRARVAWAELHPAEHPLSVPTPLPAATHARAPAHAATPTPNLPPFARLTPAAAPPSPSAGTAAPAPTATPAPIPTATPVLTPVATRVLLSGMRHNWQTWNNCGPATLAMHLSYFGSTLDQETIRKALRPNGDDKNTGPEELARYAQEQGLQARVLVNGSPQRLRLLLSNGIPVLIESWIVPKPNDGLGHYRVLVGYDDARQVWFAYDSFISTGVQKDQPYHGIEIPYDDMLRGWEVFNRTHLILFTPEQTETVRGILGTDWDETAMWERALRLARARVASQPDDPFAWFNLGSDLTALQHYDEAASAFDQARQLGLPWRMLWYQFAPFQAYFQVGRYQEVLVLTEATLATTPDVEELHYWRARALLALGARDKAKSALTRAVELNPNYTAARQLLEHEFPDSSE